MNQDDIYCIDASSLIELRNFYKEIFPNLWIDMTELSRKNRLIAPIEVLREIERIDDEILHWVRDNRIMFKQLSREQLIAVTEILKKFPDLIDPDKTTPDADPFIIALAHARQDEIDGSLFSGKCIVVTQERLSRGSRLKIPDVCAHYGIECINIRKMFNREKWQY